MNKYILIILFSTAFSLSYSKEFVGFEGYIVKNNNDTIYGKYKSISNMFYKNIFNPATVRNTVKMVDGNGIVTKYKPKDIASFVIYNPRGTGDFKFISTNADKYKHFYHEIYTGKISLYIIYDQDMRANELEKEIFIKDKKIQTVLLLSYRSDIG